MLCDLTEYYLQIQKWSYKGRGVVAETICANMVERETFQPVETKAVLQQAKAAAMCMSPHAETHPPPSIPHFASAKPSLQNRLCELKI